MTRSDLVPDRRFMVAVTLLLAIAAVFFFRESAPWLQRPPGWTLINIEGFLNLTIRAAAERAQPMFRFISWLFEWPIAGLRVALTGLPWLTFIAAAALLARTAGGKRLAIFTSAAFLYVVVIGYWTETMMTLALVAVAVPVSTLSGLLIGIAAHRRRPVRRVVEPMLDLMQTVPTFAYLIPILVLFGVGPVVGMLASAIYAIPPMVRNVMLGLDRVPPSILEPAQMAGASPRQELWWVKIPTALPTILLGVNQTIMAVLSMVVIASILGGLQDIGWEVYSTMKKAQFGQSILSGLVIALIAMVLDRVSQGFAHRPAAARGVSRVRSLIFAGCLLALTLLTAWIIPSLWDYPQAWRFYPALELNAALDWFTRTFFPITQAIKNGTVFYLLLPLKFGLLQTATPRVWGFEMGLGAGAVYWALAAIAAAAASWRWSWPAAAGILVVTAVYFFGLLGLPWLVIIGMVCVTGYTTGGWRLSLFSLAGLLFIAVNGAWEQAMMSVALTLAGVIFAFVLGSALGIWAALDDRVSAAFRPVNDTLQTLPSFVFLIPAIMVFLVGEFTALIAIVLYAIVPSIRYAEHGLRNVPAEIVEAADAFGPTPFQLFWQVRLPLALPEIMLGLNQTIMMALAMVVVAALVGAQGLGQNIMVALTWMDVGKGIVFGLSVAIIAIIADRITQGWSLKRKAALGL